MTLEFEKLTADLEQMAQTTARRSTLRRERVAEALHTLHTVGSNWTAVNQALTTAASLSDPKHYRAARPLNENTPLDARIPAPEPPPAATIIAVDGSQIMPDRHAAYLYYLINVGGIVYHHGQPTAPGTFSIPNIEYPPEDAIDEFDTNSGTINIQRDLSEIKTLASQSVANRHEVRPLLAILDQRLLYWPIGSAGVAVNAAVTEWGEHMSAMRQAGAYLCGYIDRPGTSGVVTLLRAINGLTETDFEWKDLGKQKATLGLIDTDLFQEILQPGERSCLFSFVSEPNDTFMRQDANNEVCFFFINPGPAGKNMARVDVPRWVAEDEAAVTAVHSLIINQCQLLGGYPYVLARADEMAVVGRQDAGELNFMIDIIMERHGLQADITAKQNSKEIARGGRSRFGI